MLLLYIYLHHYSVLAKVPFLNRWYMYITLTVFFSFSQVTNDMIWKLVMAGITVNNMF